LFELFFPGALHLLLQHLALLLEWLAMSVGEVYHALCLQILVNRVHLAALPRLFLNNPKILIVKMSALLENQTSLLLSGHVKTLFDL